MTLPPHIDITCSEAFLHEIHVLAHDRRSGEQVGWLYVSHRPSYDPRKDAWGRPAMPIARVKSVLVKEGYRRQGLATALYEAAVRIVAARGFHLASDTSLEPGSRRFWQKQVRKGRARRVSKLRGRGSRSRDYRYVLDPKDPRRLNPDERIRALERAAAGGDQDAMAELRRQLKRAGVVWSPISGPTLEVFDRVRLKRDLVHTQQHPHDPGRTVPLYTILSAGEEGTVYYPDFRDGVAVVFDRHEDELDPPSVLQFVPAWEAERPYVLRRLLGSRARDRAQAVEELADWLEPIGHLDLERHTPATQSEQADRELLLSDLDDTGEPCGVCEECQEGLRCRDYHAPYQAGTLNPAGHDSGYPEDPFMIEEQIENASEQQLAFYLWYRDQIIRQE